MSQDFMIRPRDNADPTQVFDKGCVESRIKELKSLIMQKLVTEDLHRFAMEYKKAFQDVPVYPFTESENWERFGRVATEEALRILEQERRYVVENRADYIKTTLNLTIKRLRFLTSTEHGKGKIYMERMIVPDRTGEGTYEERDITYFETYPEGVEIVNQISHTMIHLSGFDDYVPYMNEELKALWNEAQDLADLEIVRVEKNKDAKTETESKSLEEEG